MAATLKVSNSTMQTMMNVVKSKVRLFSRQWSKNQK